jgi:hypothetical protein
MGDQAVVFEDSDRITPNGIADDDEPPFKIPRTVPEEDDNSQAAAARASASSYSGNLVSYVVDPIRDGIECLAAGFPSIHLFATTTNQHHAEGTEVVMAAATPMKTSKPSMIRRQVTPSDAMSL